MNTMKSIFKFFTLLIGATTGMAILMAVCMATL